MIEIVSFNDGTFGIRKTEGWFNKKYELFFKSE